MMTSLGVLVLLWTRWSGTPWRDIGYARPRNWTADIVAGIVLGCAFKFVMKAIVMPLLGADPINQTYHYLVGNPAMLPGAILTMVAAGFGEETVFRGFLFERLGKVFGTGAGARAAIVLLTTALFASLHYSDQGWAGVEQAIFTGSVFGAIVAPTGRIWTVMCAHAAFDLTAVAIIYWNLESEIAHLILSN
jgi:membrane protease YdiL (CAAX protease family)